MKIKFCGIRRLEDVAAVNLCQPDYMGMILSGGFRRSISQEQAQRLVQEKSDAIAAVGVFVNESSEIICRMAEQLHLQVIQLHGNESAEQIQTLQQKTGLPVWKALRIGTLEELEAAGTNPADCLILEGKTGAGIGGTGVCADWELLARHSWNRRCPRLPDSCWLSDSRRGRVCQACGRFPRGRPWRRVRKITEKNETIDDIDTRSVELWVK